MLVHEYFIFMAACFIFISCTSFVHFNALCYPHYHTHTMQRSHTRTHWTHMLPQWVWWCGCCWVWVRVSGADKDTLHTVGIESAIKTLNFSLLHEWEQSFFVVAASAPLLHFLSFCILFQRKDNGCVNGCVSLYKPFESYLI